MAFAHAVAPAGHMESQHGHVEHFAPGLTVGPQRQETLTFNAELVPIVGWR